MPRKVNFLTMQKVRVHGKATNQKKKAPNLAARYCMGPLSNYLGSQTLQLNQEYSNKNYEGRNNLVTKNYFQSPKAMFLP